MKKLLPLIFWPRAQEGVMESPSALLIRLPERFRVNEARALSAELDRRLACDQPCLIVDFSKVKQIDTAGLNMLLECMVKIARQDGAVQVGDISPQAATMLELTRMDRVLGMFPRISEDTATIRVVPARVRADEEEPEEEQAQTEEPQPLAA
jgi:anti-anti-sigma factor